MSSNQPLPDKPETKTPETVKTPDTQAREPVSDIKRDFAQHLKSENPETGLQQMAGVTPEARKAIRRQEIILNHESKRAHLMMKGVDGLEKSWEKVIPNKTVRGVTEFLLGFIPFVGSGGQFLRGSAREQEALVQAGLTGVHVAKGEITASDAAKMWGQDLHSWFGAKVESSLGGLGLVLDSVTFGEGSAVVKGVGTAIKELNGVKVVTEAGPALVKIAQEAVKVSPKTGAILEKSGQFLNQQVAEHPLLASAVGKFVVEPHLK